MQDTNRKEKPILIWSDVEWMLCLLEMKKYEYVRRIKAEMAMRMGIGNERGKGCVQCSCYLLGRLISIFLSFFPFFTITSIPVFPIQKVASTALLPPLSSHHHHHKIQFCYFLLVSPTHIVWRRNIFGLCWFRPAKFHEWWWWPDSEMGSV